MSLRYIFFAILLMFCTVAFAQDQDSDGIPDAQDNCIETPNGPALPDSGGNSQLDSDGDGYGNICDADFNGNDIVNFADLAYFRQTFGTADPIADLDGNGVVNFSDLAIFKLSFGKPPGPAGNGINPDEVAIVELIVSSSTLNSSVTGLTSITIFAVVKNADNAVLQGVPVLFGTDSGSIVVTQPITNEVGMAIGDLSNGSDPSNRTITVTATADGVSDSIMVQVVGTELLITGPNVLAQGDTGNFISVLTDSIGVGVSGQLLGVVSALGNTITSTNMTTDVTGRINFQVTATQSGMDALTASGLGINTDHSLNVTGETFEFTAPVLQPDGSPAEIVVSSTAGVAVTVHWEIGGVNQVGLPVSFTATRGNLSSTADMLNPATSVNTDGNGNATLYIASTNAGSALIAATIAGGTTTTRSVEFVSTSPNTLILQAAKFTVPVNEQTEVIATVRDSAFNFVKNQRVNFILVNDITGGSVNPASAITGSDGRASTFYTAGSVSGPLNGVNIRAEVATVPAVNNTVSLTVASKGLDLVIGTGNVIFSPTTAAYAQEWNIFVTDSVGNAVQNKSVQVAVRSMEYIKGQLGLDPIDGAPWRPFPPLATCPEEDGSVDGVRNGILDPGEDLNGSGFLEAGNVALVAPVPDTAPPDDPCSTAGAGGTSAEVTTNAQGIARVCVFWPQDHSWWVKVQIEAQANVAGTNFSSQQVYLLPVLADDINQAGAQPPNQVSPYGIPSVTDDCSEPPPGLPFP